MKEGVGLLRNIKLLQSGHMWSAVSHLLVTENWVLTNNGIIFLFFFPGGSVIVAYHALQIIYLGKPWNYVHLTTWKTLPVSSTSLCGSWGSQQPVLWNVWSGGPLHLFRCTKLPLALHTCSPHGTRWPVSFLSLVVCSWLAPGGGSGSRSGFRPSYPWRPPSLWYLACSFL